MRYNCVELSGRLVIEARRKASRNKGELSRHHGLDKVRRNAEVGRVQGASVLGICQIPKCGKKTVRGISTCRRRATDQVCDNVSTRSLDLINTSLALSPGHIVCNSNASGGDSKPSTIRRTAQHPIDWTASIEYLREFSLILRCQSWSRWGLWWGRYGLTRRTSSGLLEHWYRETLDACWEPDYIKVSSPRYDRRGRGNLICSRFERSASEICSPRCS